MHVQLHISKKKKKKKSEEIDSPIAEPTNVRHFERIIN